MPRDYVVAFPGSPSLTLPAESINDAAEQWAALAKLSAGDDYCIDVLDGTQRYRIRVTIDQGHPVTGEPWRVFDGAGRATTSYGRPVRVIDQHGQLVLVADSAAVERALSNAREDASARLDVRIVPARRWGCPMSDTDLMLTAWLRPGARSRGLLWSEYIAHHGCSDCRAHRDLGELVDLRLIERRNPRPGQGRYPAGSSCRGRPPSVYALTALGEAVLNGLELRDSR